jgi:hypothetical protein
MPTLLEQFDTYTPLGIRFWDLVLDRQVREDLKVTARAEVNPELKEIAYRTKSDIYSFAHLPGLRDIEYAIYGSQALASPSLTRRYIIEVDDTQSAFVKMAFAVTLPLSYPGIFLTNSIASPDLAAPKGVFLFPSVRRSIPSWMAVVRGELRDWDSGQPASHALLKVSSNGDVMWHGLADEQGRFVVVFAYPLIDADFNVSPISVGYGPLYAQAWDLQLEVFYSPATLESLAGTSLPDYLSILNQSQANIWSISEDNGGVPSLSLPLLLEYQRPVIPRTEGLSYLLVGTTDTSP